MSANLTRHELKRQQAIARQRRKEDLETLKLIKRGLIRCNGSLTKVSTINNKLVKEFGVRSEW